jgi:hypothetical protein
VRKPAVIVLVVVALVAGLLAATAGKDCHYNVNLPKKLYCTDRTPPADDASDPRAGRGP